MSKSQKVKGLRPEPNPNKSQGCNAGEVAIRNPEEARALKPSPFDTLSRRKASGLKAFCRKLGLTYPTKAKKCSPKTSNNTRNTEAKNGK